MARSLIFAAALLCFVACASAQCIECSKCTPGNSYCLKNCQRSCAPAYDAKKCQQAGDSMGKREGSEACKMTMTFCSQTQAPGRSFGGSGWTPVSLGQCQNIAYGACQREGENTARWGACRTAFNGYKACSSKMFKDFFFAELNARCNQAASQIKK